MPRTTIDIDDGVLRELKARRDREHKALGVIVSELLAQALASDPAPDLSFEWVSRPMGAKVDIDDRDAMWAVLDGE